MKLIRKIYRVAVVILLIQGIPYDGVGEFITMLSMYVFAGLIFLRIVPWVFGISGSRGSGYRFGGLRNSMIGGLENETSHAVNRFMMGGGGSARAPQRNSRDEAWANKKAADQRAFERYKAKDEAIFHEYQAKKAPGTYDSFRSANRAKDAWNRSRN